MLGVSGAPVGREEEQSLLTLYGFEIALVALSSLFLLIGIAFRVLPENILNSRVSDDVLSGQSQQISTRPLPSVEERDASPFSQEEYFTITKAVARLYAVPPGIYPTVAKVDDLRSISAEPFYSKAQIGDVVLVYESIGRAILYRPSEDRIIEVGPVVVRGIGNDNGANGPTTTSPTAEVNSSQ
jgi:hypothetical protein